MKQRRREYLERLPGLAETFERDEPAMHATPTVDYGLDLAPYTRTVPVEFDFKNTDAIRFFPLQ
jgi:hypothetical protein